MEQTDKRLNSELLELQRKQISAVNWTEKDRQRLLSLQAKINSPVIPEAEKNNLLWRQGNAGINGIAKLTGEEMRKLRIIHGTA